MRKDSDTTTPAKGLGFLAAAALACTLAAHGCTTNQTPGDGTPTRVTPAGQSSPSSIPGSSSGDTPMMSSYSAALITPEVQTNTPFVHQGRNLGPANPGQNDITPTVTTNQQQVYLKNPNDEMAAGGVAAPIVSGGGDVGVVIGTPGTTMTTASTSAAPVIGSTATVTPTSATSAISSGATVGATASNTVAANTASTKVATANATNASTPILTPTVSSAITASPTAAAGSTTSARTTSVVATNVPMVSAISSTATPVVSTTTPTTAAVSGSGVGVSSPVSKAGLPVLGSTSNTASLVSLATTQPAPSVTITQTTSGRVRAVASPSTVTRVRPVRATSTSVTSSRVRAVRTSGGVVITNQQP